MMDEATQSSANKTNKHQAVCRFCFGKREIDEVFFDIFASKIGDKILFEFIKNMFAVLEIKTYKQGLNARYWTSDYLQVVEFAINDDNTILRGICVKCLQVIIEIDSFAIAIRSSNLEQFIQAPFETKLEICNLKTTDGLEIQHEQIMKALNIEKETDINTLSNFWNTCKFCLQHKSMLLFDIYTSKIGNNSIVDVIKMCTATYRQQDVHVFVHLRKSYLKTITVPDYEWTEIKCNLGPRKICIDCLQPLIKFNFLIDRIRKTNAALSLFDFAAGILKGTFCMSLLHSNLENQLNKCFLMTCKGEIISTQEVVHTMQLRESSYQSHDVYKENQTLVTPYEYRENDEKPNQIDKLFLTIAPGAPNSNIFCRLCDTFIDGCSNLDQHVLMHIQEAR